MSNMKQKIERKTRARSTVVAKEKPGPSNTDAKKTEKAATTTTKRKAPPKETEIQEPVINDVKQNGKRRKVERGSVRVQQKNVNENVEPAVESSDEETEVMKGKTGRKQAMKVKKVEVITLADEVEEVAQAEVVEEVAQAEVVEEVAQAEEVEEVAQAEEVEEVAQAEEVEEVTQAEEAEEVTQAEEVEEATQAKRAKRVTHAKKVEATRAKKVEATQAKKVEATQTKRARGATQAKKVEEATQAKKAKRAEPRKVAKAKAGVKRQKAVLEVPKLPTISGTLFVVGNNETGQLGLIDVVGKKRPVENPVGAHFVDVAAGGMHSLCLTDKGEVYTFGCNDENALGRQTGDDETLEQTPMKVDIPHLVVKISAGDCHSAALTENGKVYIWGTFRDNKGIIGLTPHVFKSNSPLQILKDVTIVDIASGSEHFVCLSNEGNVYTCGCAETGQLGRIPERSSKGNGRKGLVELLEPKIVPLRQSGKPVLISNIWTGADYTFLKSQTNGAIYAFGLNNYYQLGLPLKLGEQGVDGPCSQYKPVQIDAFSTNSGWQCISGGQHHTLALDNDGLIHVLGRKEYGRLGLGENCDHTQVPTAIPALAQQKCVHISCADQASFSIVDNGTLYSWGFGTNHQLGHGTDDDVFEPQLVEGKFRSAWSALKVSGGGQHTLILAKRKETTTEEAEEKTGKKK